MKTRVVILSWLLAGVGLGCAEHEDLLGSGASLTSTPCDSCSAADRPALTCPAGQAPACFKRTDGACGWQSECSGPPPGSICTAIGCAVTCPNGYVKDANGCDTCTCIPPADSC